VRFVGFLTEIGFNLSNCCPVKESSWLFSCYPKILVGVDIINEILSDSETFVLSELRNERGLNNVE